MNPKLLELFPGWSSKFEGRVPWMYLDIRGIVTTCVGNALFSPDEAAKYPWVYKETGTPATYRDIANEYVLIRDLKVLAKQGHLAAAQHCRLRLTDDAMDNIVREKMLANHEQMKKGHGWPDLDSWPLDAQLAVHSMAWACGPAFDDPGAPGRFVKLGRLLKGRNFEEAVNECHMNEITPEGHKNGGLVARNVANKLLFSNATVVEKHSLDRNRLYWPLVLGSPSVLERFLEPSDPNAPSAEEMGDQPIVHAFPEHQDRILDTE